VNSGDGGKSRGGRVENDLMPMIGQKLKVADASSTFLDAETPIVSLPFLDLRVSQG
jgi:hypothetical protein